MTNRPSFIRSASEITEHVHVYPQSTEPMGPVRRLGREAGLERIGINIQRLPPGSRSSWPHAEENEEEFVYVLEGEVDAWIDGETYRMTVGDLAAFPAGTGVSHCFINNTDHEVVLLVGGEAPKPGSRIFYPLNPSRRTDMDASNWWQDVPHRQLGPHDGLPNTLRNPGGMKIQRATIADAPRISALIRELSTPFLVSPSGEGAEPFLAAISESAIQGYVAASNFEYLVAEDQGQLVGVVALRDNSHLYHLFVAVPLQGRGLGGKLWDMVKAKALLLGNPGKFTVNSSLNAVPVYERFGFIASGPVVQANGVVFQPMQLSQPHNAA